jgi:hypothetical protein
MYQSKEEYSRQIKEQSKISLSFSPRGEFKVDISGELNNISPEILEKIQQISDSANYHKQKDTELEKARIAGQNKIDFTVCCFSGALFLMLTYLTSTIVSHSIQVINQPFNSNQIQLVKEK